MVGQSILYKGYDVFVAWPVYSGMALFGAAAGVLGVFVVLRRLSLLTDAISHATLPGFVVALWFFKATGLEMLIGGICSGAMGAFLVLYMQKYTKLKIDALLGVVLSVFFGLGLVFLSIAQKNAVADHALLMRLLLGNPVLIMDEDFIKVAVVTMLIFAVLCCLRRSLVIMLFDQCYAHCIGISLSFYDNVLLFLLLMLVSVGLPLMGVILMSTIIIAPAVAARQWSSCLSLIIPIAAGMGMFSCITGTYVSSQFLHTPTGPAISIIAISITFFSIACAPHRGMLWATKGAVNAH
jgi:manganese/zinc/iron transport system permease protein